MKLSNMLAVVALLLIAALAFNARGADIGTGSPPVAKVAPAKAKPVAVKPLPIGYHEHVCPRCQTRWGHGESSRANAEEHRCPTCNHMLPWPWDKAPPATQRFMRICENGKCRLVPIP